jgi:hypothetical protein
MLLSASLIVIFLAATGCSTSGPNHLYIAKGGGEPIHDVSHDGTPATEVPSRTTVEEKVLGLAYDFYTDELFVRLAPGNLVRVVDRPSQRLLRDMTLPELPPHTANPVSADLTIRSRNRHLFLVDADGRSIVEYSLFGEFLRRLAPEVGASSIGGLAFDQINDRLLVLLAGDHPVILTCTLDGREESRRELQKAVLPLSLAYDSTAQHFFVPLPGGKTVGVFDAQGHHLSTISPTATTGDVSALAAGERSFVRIF